ncbi:GNAT family N-acetyltransferase [Nonomuraea sp. NPDC048826]|uniref:GNAT family N-acetyltransferase n=1 Tax=Nonomuraea sp. NPDC048826 TaxID=3364347 RepID=UPI0037149F90
MTCYGGPRDLRAMQELTGRIWSPRARWHAGDLAWGRFQHTGRESEWPTMVWRAERRTLAWGWIELPGYLNLAVDPDHAELAHDVLRWFEETVPAGERQVSVSSGEPHLVSALEERGYARQKDGPFMVQMVRDLDGLPEPEPPAGYRLEAVRDVAGRVAAHQAAFHPSRVTEESYAAVRAAWPYRAELDWCAIAPDGHTAAYCLIWLDDRQVALIEPVGTVPEHRRKGLAKAVCLAALHAARAAGGKQAVVAPRGDAAYPVPARLYSGIGFRDTARSLLFTG